MTVAQLVEFYNKWQITLHNLERAEEAEVKLFEELKVILKLHPELGNRAAINESLKLKIADAMIKKYNSGGSSAK